MTFSITGSRTRTREQLKRHYDVEKVLAERLREAPREKRLHMLTGLYEELFQRVPDHPRLTRMHRPEESRRYALTQMRFLKRFLHPQMTFLEIGPGDCALSFVVSRAVRQVYGVDVDFTLTRNAAAPANFQLCLSDGISVPVPAGSVDAAYSNQLMEHLHPQDARDQLRNIFAALAPGGVYVCITPNRLDGPHDVSRNFSDKADGFHLKEYTMSELEALFRATGFGEVAIYAKARGLGFRLPLRLMRAIEALLERLPAALRRAIARTSPVRQLLNAAVVARKP